MKIWVMWGRDKLTIAGNSESLLVEPHWLVYVKWFCNVGDTKVVKDREVPLQK